MFWVLAFSVSWRSTTAHDSSEIATRRPKTRLESSKALRLGPGWFQHGPSGSKDV